jgi:hypothetical protein
VIILITHILAGIVGWGAHWMYRRLGEPPEIPVTKRQLKTRPLELPRDGDDTRPLRKTNPDLREPK